MLNAGDPAGMESPLSGGMNLWTGLSGGDDWRHAVTTVTPLQGINLDAGAQA
jgi:hypothetical protein